jgi:ABC-type branched-subunit amino acid transport system substrate-binding protein
MRGVGAFAVVALTFSGLAACSDDGDDNASDSPFKPLYLVDGNLSNTLLPEDSNIALAGTKGTLPGADVGDEFRQRLLDVDPDLEDFAYGPESYDAAVTIALAAIAADSDAGKDIASEMVNVTNEGEKCTTVQACVDLLADGTDIDYDGVSGPIAYDAAGDPTEATIGLYEYGDDNTYTAQSFESGTVDASEAPEPITDRTNAGGDDGVLTIGTLLPLTGSLAFLGPPEVAGVTAAIEDINAAGGFNGEDVELVETDSGDTSTNTATTSVDTLLSNDVDAIIGAASSSVSLSVIDKITGAGVVQVSPANTSPAFTTYEDGGLYFRTAPSDVLQGRVHGNTVLADGAQTLGILQLQDSYGDGLSASITDAFEGGGGEVLETIVYDPKASTFSSEVSAIKQANPDAITIIGFEETAKILEEMAKQGLIATRDGATAEATP